MDNIADILSSLSDEDMQTLKGMAQDLFGGEAPTEPKEGGAPSLPPEFAALDLKAISKLMARGDDARTQLIQSLKPMLSSARQQRAEEAIRLLHLISLLPALKESGILDQFLG